MAYKSAGSVNTGSIKSQGLPVPCAFGICFDSILVRLKVVQPSKMRSVTQCFDSILVRLKVHFITVSKYCCRMFRFHTGSIKSFCCRTHKSMLALFRFHTGSIKRITIDKLRSARAPVSIPYWFD